MKDQINTIREALEKMAETRWPATLQTALTALSELERMAREPVAILWQVRRALARACAICDAVPSREPGHLGKLVNAQPDGTHGYREIHDAEAALVAYLTTPEAAPPTQQPSKATLEKLRAWETNGELIDRAWQVLQSQEQEIMRLEKMLAEERAHGIGEQE